MISCGGGILAECVSFTPKVIFVALVSLFDEHHGYGIRVFAPTYGAKNLMMAMVVNYRVQIEQ